MGNENHLAGLHRRRDGGEVKVSLRTALTGGMKYNGIDLHSNNSVVTVTDEDDRVVAERRLPNELGRIVGFYALGGRSWSE